MKSTMMSSPLLVNSILERAAALFPDVAIVSMQPDGSRHSYTYRGSAQTLETISGGS